MEGTTLLWLFIAAVVVIFVLANSIKVVQEYERGVIFRLGRLVGASGPGLFFIIPILDRIVRIDLRVVTLEIPTQEIITRDNVSVRVNAVLYFRVYDPAKAVVNVTDFIRATLQIAQTTLRSVLGQSELDELLSQRDRINEILQRIIDKQTEPWGIKVSTVEVKDVELPQTMQRAMARQAEAEREKRAKIIHAQGELQASESLAEAAKIIGQEGQTLQLRYLQTLTEIAAEKNSTIVFPIPLDLITPFLHHLNPAAATTPAKPEQPAQKPAASRNGAETPTIPKPDLEERLTSVMAALPSASTLADKAEKPTVIAPEMVTGIAADGSAEEENAAGWPQVEANAQPSEAESFEDNENEEAGSDEVTEGEEAPATGPKPIAPVPQPKRRRR
jgi:regulator of protease activity HflC (stomatin/prohibitin superfamily)